MITGGEYATQLTLFSAAIKKRLKPFNASPLDRVALLCNSLQANTGSWAYDLEELNFPRYVLKNVGLDHTRPNGTKSFSIKLQVKASGPYQKVSGAQTDPMETLELNLIALGFNSVADPREELTPELFCAWHLDAEPNHGNLSAFAHPRYHWHFGGKRVWEWANSRPDFFGAHLLLESPRILHPPLDAILAVDFVLSHFYAPTWQELRRDAPYQLAVAYAQQLYWRPYFETIAASANWANLKSAKRPFLYWP